MAEPAPPFRVRHGGGAPVRVRLAPGTSEAGVKEAVAGAVGLPVGAFFLRDAEGGVSAFHAGLAGDWDAVLLPGAGAAPAAERSDELLAAAMRTLGDRVDAMGERLEAIGVQTVELLRHLQVAVAGVRQRQSPPREGEVGRIFAAGGSLPSTVPSDGGSVAGALLPAFDDGRPGGGSGSGGGGGDGGGGGGGGGGGAEA